VALLRLPFYSARLSATPNLITRQSGYRQTAFGQFLCLFDLSAAAST
jgi:hypothetical protein